jgi:hypothetical protein
MGQTGQLQELVFSTCQNIQVRGVYVGTLQEPFRTRYQGLRDWWHTSSDMRWLAAKRIRHHHTGRVDSTCTAIANNRPTLTKNVWIDSFPTNEHGMAWHGMTYYGKVPQTGYLCCILSRHCLTSVWESQKHFSSLMFLCNHYSFY